MYLYSFIKIYIGTSIIYSMTATIDCCASIIFTKLFLMFGWSFKHFSELVSSHAGFITAPDITKASATLSLPAFNAIGFHR